MRDFMASRVVGGRQQIRTAMTFHESGRLVMWPYGYTMTDVPGDMTYAGPRGAGPDRPDDGRRPTATSRSRRATCTSARARAATTSTASTGSSPYTFEMSVGRLPGRFADRGRDRAQQGSRAVRDGARLVPAVGARRRGPHRALRRLRRRPRGLPWLDREPGRHRHSARSMLAGSRANPAATSSHGPEAARHHAVRDEGLRDRRVGRLLARPRTISTGERRSARRRSSCRRPPASV